MIKNRCLNGSVHVYVESLKWNIISDKYFQWREVYSWDFPKKENRCILCKQEKLLLYWKGFQSSHTILGQLSRAFQLDGLVGIAVDRVIAGGQDGVCCFLLLWGAVLYIPTQRYWPLTPTLIKRILESRM